jgi:hypothetical protein
MNISKVETLKIYPADVAYVEPIASSYCITIKLNKISIKITLIYVWNKKFCKRNACCVHTAWETLRIILSCSLDILPAAGMP